MQVRMYADTKRKRRSVQMYRRLYRLLFTYGGSADGVIAQIRLLTGSVPMMPLWSYGFMQKQRAL